MVQHETPSGASWRHDARLLDGLTVAAVVVEPSGRISYVNEAAVTLFGRLAGALVRGDVRSALFADRDRGAVDEVLHRVLEGAVWSGELEMVGAGGRGHLMATSWSPMTTADDGTVGAVVLVEEAARGGAHARRLAHRMRKLAAVTTGLLFAADLKAVTAVVVEQMTDAAGATVGSLSMLVDDDTLALLGIRGGAEGVASRWATYPLAASTPAGDALRAGEALVLMGPEELQRRYPGLEAAAEGDRLLVCLPLIVTGRRLGVVTLSFPGRRAIDAAELEFLGIQADVCAQAIDRIRSQEEVADRETKLRFLAEASAQLAGDLNYEATLRRVAELAVPRFADWCAISVAEDGRLRTLAVAHASPQHEALVRELQDRYPPSPEQPRGTYQVLRTGVSEVAPDISDELLAAVAHDEDHLRMLRALNFRSAMAVPLKVRDRVLGVVTWVTGEEGRRFGPGDVEFGEDLARRAATAIDTAELHSQLRDVALRLQRAILPAELPPVAGFELGVRYLPAGRTGAGGDFYDVVPLSDGRLAVFVGDVMGRGVEAASVMAQMRSAIRTLVALDAEPEAVMRGLDRVFDLLHIEQLVTVVYAVADPAGGTVRIVNAGHPAPILVSGDGTAAHLVSAETLILGVGGAERSVATSPFGDGDVLLLFTDGLVERRSEDLDAGLARLLDASRSLRGAPLSEGLRLVVDAVRDPGRDDDVAALAVRRTATGGAAAADD